MAAAVVSFDTSNFNKDIKDQAEEIFNELGLNMTTAINMFLRTAIREHGIPFEHIAKGCKHFGVEKPRKRKK